MRRGHDADDVVSAACEPDSFEPNESAGAAKLVSTTEGYHDAFLCAGDEDWYLVPASQNGPVNVSVNVAVLHALYQNDGNICTDGALPAVARSARLSPGRSQSTWANQRDRKSSSARRRAGPRGRGRRAPPAVAPCHPWPGGCRARHGLAGLSLQR